MIVIFALVLEIYVTFCQQIICKYVAGKV